eukprot:GHVU01131985.1.p2 GENE.GHVU01131985.1~~GHVU01131985.1.p2  ORF type:complete len:102 (-),score=25.08 GHVU01131985.1:267-572(-)
MDKMDADKPDTKSDETSDGTKTAKKEEDDSNPFDVLLPDPSIADLKHKVHLSSELISEEDRLAARDELLKKIDEHVMLPLYKQICAALPHLFPRDAEKEKR